MDTHQIDAIMSAQSGVISRQQLFLAGAAEQDIRRMLRRRDLARAQRGVFINHTGPTSWLQRVWVGCLRYGGAAGGPTALRLWLKDPTLSPDSETIEIAVASTARPGVIPGFTARRLNNWSDFVRTDLSPPCERLEHAAARAASREGRTSSAVELIAKLLRRGHSHESRLRSALLQHATLANRRWLLSVLDDIASGQHSVLEREFVRRVERPHRLPPAIRQTRRLSDDSITYRDAEFLNGLIIVEFDGYHFHSHFAAYQADLGRDLDAAATGARTIRVGWAQVIDTPCRTARRLGQIFNETGWQGRVTACSLQCDVNLQT